MNKPKPTIAELEKMLDEDGENIEILPDGSLRAVEEGKKPRKPLTMEQRLGGEYGS